MRAQLGGHLVASKGQSTILDTQKRTDITVLITVPFYKVTHRIVTSEMQQRCGGQGCEVMFNQPMSKIKPLSLLTQAMCHLKLHLPLKDKQIAVEQKGHGWLEREWQGYIPPKTNKVY